MPDVGRNELVRGRINPWRIRNYNCILGSINTCSGNSERHSSNSLRHPRNLALIAP